jgi:predicted nucleic acid-binding protein
MIAADSNVIIAAVSKWNPFHIPAVTAVNHALADQQLILPQHTLLESYSVLRRLPPPHELPPDVVFALLHDTFSSARIVNLSIDSTWKFLKQRDEVTGRRLYDASIAMAAIEAGAQQLLTFNPRDFQSFADQIEIVVPS